jgi:hypothetical protein
VIPSLSGYESAVDSWRRLRPVVPEADVRSAKVRPFANSCAPPLFHAEVAALKVETPCERVSDDVDARVAMPMMTRIGPEHRKQKMAPWRDEGVDWRG